MSKKTIFITGSTDGIGKQTAADLAKLGHTVIIHGRNKQRLADSLDFINKEAPNSTVFPVLADFNSMEQIIKMCNIIEAKFDKIDIMFHNAATFSNEKEITEDGNELTFQVNHLSTVLITKKLEKLFRNAPTCRIIFLSSMLHAASLSFDNLQGEKTYKGNENYALSKLCNILTANYLADYFEGTNITSNSVHPGVIETKLLNAAWSGGFPISEGAKNLTYLVDSELLGRMTGLYLENGRPMQSNPISLDKEVQKKLWKRSIKSIQKYI